ncbi:MAG: hypothetical protein PF508_15855, partial [Spirochaeta sp.]|nr:hypothetical protein [Spirochaeta sp.]
MTAGTIPEFYFSELDSTMNRAREIAARDDAMDDLFRVRAAHQFAGRGRRGNRWFDLPGNAVMMTMAVRRGGAYDPGDTNPGTLALRAGAALLSAIHHFVPPGERSRVQIKWPNDILLDEGKLAGILVEADPRWFYVGFGVNAFAPETCAAELYS